MEKQPTHMSHKRHGKHLLLLLSILLTSSLTLIKAQSPGGVSSPELWLKTVPVSSNLQGTYHWKDISGDSVRLNNYDSRGSWQYGTEYTLARTQIRTYNFNPALDLTEVGYSKELLIGKTNLSQATIIGVWGSDYTDFDQDMFMYTINGRAGDGMLMTKDKVLESKESARTTLDYGEKEGDDLKYSANDREKTINKFRERALRVQTYYRINKPNNSDVWGEKQKAVITLGDLFYTNNTNNSSTYNTAELNNRKYWGYTPELIIYNRMLTPLERLRVETYLAIKYGFALNTSYIGKGNTLIWDLADNDGYNTRITGISRDDAGALQQPISTTSFEEAPYYSDDYGDYFDSYDLDNSYNRASRYRLLVMGRPYGTNMKDGEYTLWGDDDKTFRVQNRMIGGMKTMSRNWKVRTNVTLPAGYNTPANNELWTCTNIQISANNNLRTFIKETADNAPTGTAVTNQPLSGTGGYFSWTVGAVPTGAVTIKFGTQNPTVTAGTNDYGYYINNYGQVFPIVAGVRKTGYIATVYNNQKIEIEKTIDKISLRVNGAAILNQDIQINTSDTNKTYYGTLLVEKGTADIKLLSLAANGFYYGNSGQKSNGSHRMEISYEGQRATDFNAYHNGQAYLIVDRSGTGTYPKESTEYFLSDEMDESRYKIIFNNIYWDADNNGSDVFTFGYVETGKLALSVDSINPTCNGNTANKDGIINVAVSSGLRGFNYTLTNTTDTSIKKTGQFFTDSLHINALPAGKYKLDISEIGGYNLQSAGAATFRPSAVTTGYTYNANCAVDFLAGGLAADGKTLRDSGAAAGFKLVTTTYYIPSTGFALPDYGVFKNGSDLYAVTKGVTASTSFATVVTGDKIKIERNNGNFICSINGVEKFRVTIIAADLPKYYIGAVTLPASTGTTSNELCNLNITGFAAGTWQCSDDIIGKLSALAKTTTTATLIEDCYASTPLLPPSNMLKAADTHLQTYYKDINNLKTVTAKVTLNEAGNSQLLVFNISGQLVYQTMLNSNEKVQEKDISLDVPGVYIIKAITPEGEFSTKVMIQ